MTNNRRPGFTIPGYAAAAASKNHQLGTAHKFDRSSASEAGRKSAEKRREQRTEKVEPDARI
jgi:hypothetical protein